MLQLTPLQGQVKVNVWFWGSDLHAQSAQTHFEFLLLLFSVGLSTGLYFHLVDGV